MCRSGSGNDPNKVQSVRRGPLAYGADVVGFTALGCNFQCVVRAAEVIRRRRPDLPLLLGGPHASILHEQILSSFSTFDIVFRHEAEETLLPALERLGTSDLSGIPGVSFRDKDGRVVCNPGKPTVEDLDELPMPAFDVYPIGELGLSNIRIEAGRGCPFSCRFCSTASFFGRTYRLKSPERLLSEMRLLRDAYGHTDFQLNHDLFTVDKRKVHAFCDAVRGEGFHWRCSARADCVDEQLIEAMASAGCQHIYFGIETGSQRMQRVADKRLDLALVEPVLDVTSRLGMASTTSFITGFPEEELVDQEETLDLLGRLHHRADDLNLGQLYLLTPEPGTYLIQRYGSELRLDEHTSGFNFPRIDAEDGVLLAEHAELFPNHYYFPSKLSRERHIFVTSGWLVLNEIGAATFRYLLGAFDGSLAKLLGAAYEHWTKTGRSQSIGAAVEGMLRDRFGDDHHLVSLVRFGRAVRDARPGWLSEDLDSAVDPRDLTLSVSPTTTILRRIHDCSTLITRLSKEGRTTLLDDDETGPLGPLLLVAAAPQPRVFRIDGPTADLIERFEQPTSYWQCCMAMAEEKSAVYPAWDEVERLHSLGVLRVAGGQPA